MFRQTYTYADIGLIPTKVSTIRSRDEVDTNTAAFGTKLSIPLVVSPMETVVSARLANAVADVGGVCFLPRTKDFEKDRELFLGILIQNQEYVVPCVGLGQEAELGWYLDQGISKICIDVANGAHQPVLELVDKIRKYHPHIHITTGNVASLDTFCLLEECGVDAIRVGIGNGSVCTTSLATGIGVGQATLIDDIVGEGRSTAIIADGGIKCPGDMVKALALGADVVMSGSIFAGCIEGPGMTMHGDSGEPLREYAGQASAEVKGFNKYIEGAQRFVPLKGSVVDVWREYTEGLRSAMAYLDCRQVSDFARLHSRNFCALSPSAKVERGVHV